MKDQIIKLLKKFYFQLILFLCALSLIPVMPNSERIGDRLQYIVPSIGLLCSLEAKEAGSYFARYATGLATVHTLKNTLPESELTTRPNGGSHGFPSGHTYSASFGASYIARKCAQRVPYLGVVAVVAAAFTGVSRAESRNHTTWQVLWGMITAILFDRGFRSIKSRAFWSGILDKFKSALSKIASFFTSRSKK